MSNKDILKFIEKNLATWKMAMASTDDANELRRLFNDFIEMIVTLLETE